MPRSVENSNVSFWNNSYKDCEGIREVDLFKSISNAKCLCGWQTRPLTYETVSEEKEVY